MLSWVANESSPYLSPTRAKQSTHLLKRIAKTTLFQKTFNKNTNNQNLSKICIHSRFKRYTIQCYDLMFVYKNTNMKETMDLSFFTSLKKQ